MTPERKEGKRFYTHTHWVCRIEHAIGHELCHRVEVVGSIPAHREPSSRNIKTHRAWKHLLPISLRRIRFSRRNGGPVASSAIWLRLGLLRLGVILILQAISDLSVLTSDSK